VTYHPQTAHDAALAAVVESLVRLALADEPGPRDVVVNPSSVERVATAVLAALGIPADATPREIGAAIAFSRTVREHGAIVETTTPGLGKLRWPIPPGVRPEGQPLGRIAERIRAAADGRDPAPVGEERWIDA